MPSPYTSLDNVEDTRQLAENLGVALETIPIEGVFEKFLQVLAPSFDRRAPGITEQNIQARIRGTLLMAISNETPACLLLSTGNKSELAVGYCTLYGDMSGGLAVISDVPHMYGSTTWRISSTAATASVIPARIVSKAPSAELKPDQRDDDDLPPYDVLDPTPRDTSRMGWALPNWSRRGSTGGWSARSLPRSTGTTISATRRRRASR